MKDGYEQEENDSMNVDPVFDSMPSAYVIYRLLGCDELEE